MFNSPFYIGIIKVKGQVFDGGHEQLIKPELFKTVQAILRGNTNQKINKHVFKFSKKLTCSGCGYSLIAEVQKGHVYYRCHTKNCVTKGIRETAVENFLLKALATAQLHPEESTLLDELIQEEEQQVQSKQQKLLTAVRLQKTQIAQKIERLTDTYLEGDLEQEIFRHRKEKLLLESKSKEAAEHEILYDLGKVFAKARRFLEQAKSLISSYETGSFEERKELVETVTSNLAVERKKLITTMKSPFYELSERHDLCLGEPKRDGHRTRHPILAYSDINTSPIIGKPLSKDRLQLLLDEILHAVSQLPENNPEDEYGI
jgi:hypothetical protein